MKEDLIKIFYESAELKRKFIDSNWQVIIKCVELFCDALKRGNKIVFFGNGGSAADAQHLTAEFVNRFSIDRAPLAAMSLTTDTSVLTSIANDFDYDSVFSKQILALGKKGDIAFGISTSGNSPNVIKALLEAKRVGMVTVALTGNSGGKMKDIADLSINVDSKNTPRVQETHITIGHALCGLVERNLMVDTFELE